jgi:hypothetical protein
MQHEHTLDDAGGSFEVNAVTVRNLVVVLHKVRGHLERTNEVFLLTRQPPLLSVLAGAGRTRN